jgi:hypothetical protein
MPVLKDAPSMALRNQQKITPDRRSAWLVVAERAAHYRSRLIDLAGTTKVAQRLTRPAAEPTPGSCCGAGV